MRSSSERHSQSRLPPIFIVSTVTNDVLDVVLDVAPLGVGENERRIGGQASREVFRILGVDTFFGS